jgi:uncharacterized protein
MDERSFGLERLISTLVDVYQPWQLYLYGSRVWGRPRPGSDIDILVLLRRSELGQADRIRLGLRALFGSGLDVDLLVLTEAEIQESKDHPSTLVHKVMTEGKKIYEAA